MSMSRKNGYTLLEVVLALGLSVLLIGGISMAINFHMRTLRQQQIEIERSQVARQSLFLITKDIRAAIQYKPIETSALNELIESVSSATDVTGMAEDAGLSEDLIDQAGIGGGTAADDEDPAESEYQATRPGLYGTATELQIDVSRLPRKDQYSVVTFSDGTQSDITSDVKTVTYFVRNEENYEENSSADNVSISQFGLVRRSIDRAVTRYALDYGGQINLEDYEEVLAEEISEIEFRYWDQTNKEWVTEWDSDEMMGLPGAVEVSVALGVKAEDNEEDERKIYRSVVYLPIAEIIPPEPEPVPDEEAESLDSAESGGSEE